MHHVDRVKRQLGGEQQIPEDPVNLDGFLSASTRGEDQWWPTKHVEWYDDWRGRFQDDRQVTITPTAYPAMATREYFTWWLDVCRHCHFSPANALDDPRLDDLPDDIPQTTSQPRDALRLPGDVPITRRRGRDTRLDIQRHVRGGRGKGPDGEPQRPVGAMDSKEEEEYARQEDVPGPSAHGGEAEPVQPERSSPCRSPLLEQLDDDFFTGAEDDFAARFGDPEYAPSGQIDPDVGFLARVSGSQIEGIASRYQGIRDACITQQVAPVRLPLQSTAPDLSWIPPVTPPFAGFVRGFSSLPGHQFGTPPSWEYQPMQPGSGSSSTHPVHDQHPPPAPCQTDLSHDLTCSPHSMEQPRNQWQFQAENLGTLEAEMELCCTILQNLRTAVTLPSSLPSTLSCMTV
ncbi:hypothetical protein PIB30_037046 [Stylosanthes scabra]|uniref:Aminotransferase-like plant mobile domain-containing protein n=1 Tax=Stylosanthes scabra TaxID=79078 RepID=A0ABU6UEW9_9FABA|nr:hypothetical protein [Stylosanthes scabra]